jgi:hypothetical protein
MAKVGMGAIPNTTASVVKFVRTGEGMLVVAFNIALMVVPTISSALTRAQAVKWAAVINGAAVMARTELKMTAVVQSGGTATALAAAPSADPGALGDTTPAISDSGREARTPPARLSAPNRREPLPSVRHDRVHPTIGAACGEDARPATPAGSRLVPGQVLARSGARMGDAR